MIHRRETKRLTAMLIRVIRILRHSVSRNQAKPEVDDGAQPEVHPAPFRLTVNLPLSATEKIMSNKNRKNRQRFFASTRPEIADLSNKTINAEACNSGAAAL